MNPLIIFQSAVFLTQKKGNAVGRGAAMGVQ